MNRLPHAPHPNVGFMLPKNAFYHAFCLIPCLGPATINKILEYCSHDAEQAWLHLNDLPPHLFTRVDRLAALAFWKKTNPETAWERLDKQGIKTVSLEEYEYPLFLKRIHIPPPILYYKGALPSLAKPILTVVGTRKVSTYGQMAIEHLLTPVANAGIGIISGLAFGVDAAAHRLALKNNSYTLAVLGSGVDTITPAAHTTLGYEILESGGGIMSEFPPGRESFPSNFPRRNRLLAGLSPFTLVIEAATKSGALITAKYALDENREVGAVPGPIHAETSAGCHQLIRQGASLVTSADDLLAFYNLSPGAAVPQIRLNEEEAAFIRHLEPDPLPLDLILIRTKKASSEALTLLTTLELKGVVRHTPGRGYGLQVLTKRK